MNESVWVPRDQTEALRLPEREAVHGLARVLRALGGNLVWSWKARRSLRARHNDHDGECVFWWGGRRMEPGDYTVVFNTELDGEWTSLFDRRCQVCNPYLPQEGTLLVDPEEPFRQRLSISRTP